VTWLIKLYLDEWLNPQSSTAVTAADAKGAETMVPRMLQLTAGHGPNITTVDSLKAAAGDCDCHRSGKRLDQQQLT